MHQTIANLRTAFASRKTLPLLFRVKQLSQLDLLLKENEDALAQALWDDLRKPKFEGVTGEIAFLRGEIRHALRHLRSWTKARRVHTQIVHFPARSEIVQEPLGVVLIIGAWNYPVQLIFSPMVAAISAGNCVILKPSELAPRSAELISQLLPRYLDTDCFAVVQGGAEETTNLLKERFDAIFFTGSARVGKIVMESAAKHLTPVTLELGGKSPCIVDKTANLKLAARRIAWGKFSNAGQTCIAPDYVLADKSIKSELVEELKKAIRDFYGADPKTSPDYGRIVNNAHCVRLSQLTSHEKIAFGGEHDFASKYFAPTLVDEPKIDSPLMEEEIFGPILPVLGYDQIDDAIKFVLDREKPLALYVFSRDAATLTRFKEETSCGGMSLNDTLCHITVSGLPFGGVGASGFGAYRGETGFKTFSHAKGVFRKSAFLDIPLRYPPYSNFILKLAKWFL